MNRCDGCPNQKLGPNATCCGRRVCRYPHPPAGECRCSVQMGMDFLFLPSDRCLWDDEPKKHEPKKQPDGFWFGLAITICAVLLLCGVIYVCVTQ
jgi:hypothetical protein